MAEKCDGERNYTRTMFVDDLTDVSKIVKLCILWDSRKARKSATTWIINIGSKK